ncbi:MAG: hypothetical protein ACE5FG_03325 [Myxococcota bacterium]
MVEELHAGTALADVGAVLDGMRAGARRLADSIALRALLLRITLPLLFLVCCFVRIRINRSWARLEVRAVAGKDS